MWQWPKRALLISLNNDNNNRFALCLDEERLNWVCEGVQALESGGVAEGGSHCWNGWVKWAFYWGLSLANLPHVTAQPDLLPWNATGCCAEDKKRQRLKLQGCNTSWSWRAAQLCQERKKTFSGFPHTPLPIPPSTTSKYSPSTVMSSSSAHSPPIMMHMHSFHPPSEVFWETSCTHLTHRSVSVSLPLSPVPTVVPVMLCSHFRTTSGLQP